MTFTCPGGGTTGTATAARWTIASDGEVVGLCSYLLPPENDKATIGYGVAEKRRRLGHATRAVAAMIQAAEADPNVQILTAETSIKQWNLVARIGEEWLRSSRHTHRCD